MLRDKMTRNNPASRLSQSSPTSTELPNLLARGDQAQGRWAGEEQCCPKEQLSE